MPKFNDFDMKEWRLLSDIETDSLWLIDRRDNSGKHEGGYHGNFIPQIPRQFIKRFTKPGDTVLDPFMGGGTTAYECETLGRNFIGIDIKQDIVDYVGQRLLGQPSLPLDGPKNTFSLLLTGDSTAPEMYDLVREGLAHEAREKVQLVILHPPYFDILKFSDAPSDLSNAKTLADFVEKFGQVVRNCMEVLEDDRHLAVVIGDKYARGRWLPLGFYCMQECMNAGLTLKSIVVKNMDGSRAKQGKTDIWRYRALSSDYYVFKHEYILLFKK
ncbi:MAG: site-specific DNA-methyltransferase [Alphaproteobacteria bacterium]|nr:site-specific DNA-methyltransferase [Alphaproteobacteria bacterium]